MHNQKIKLDNSVYFKKKQNLLNKQVPTVPTLRIRTQKKKCQMPRKKVLEVKRSVVHRISKYINDNNNNINYIYITSIFLSQLRGFQHWLNNHFKIIFLNDYTKWYIHIIKKKSILMYSNLTFISQSEPNEVQIKTKSFLIWRMKI